ncbi:MAG: S8 family serine peptidase [Methanobacteriota archaeon]
MRSTSPRPTLSLLLLLMAISPGLLGAIAPPAVAVPNPDHDIVDARLRVDDENLYFDVTVAGIVQPSRRGGNEFRLFFGIVPPATASLAAPARNYVVINGSSSNPAGWFLFNNVAGSAFLGSPLAMLHPSGTNATTFTVPRDLVQTVLSEGASEGARLTGVRISYRLNGTEVDSLPVPDFVIPAVERDALLFLHLAASGSHPFVHRTLSSAPPGTDPPRADPIYVDTAGSALFRSAPFAAPIMVTGARVDLWMAFSATTPALAASVFNARVYRLDPDGTRTLIGQREPFAAGANANVFTTPGVPQQIRWQLTFTQPAVSAGSSLLREVAAQGFFNRGDSGPAVLLYGSERFDSTLLLRGTAGSPPLVPLTDPPLGTLVYSLRGASGALTTTRPAEETPEAVVAAGSADVTPAVWRSSPLSAALTVTRATAEIVISSTTATPALALNFLDARVYADTAEGSVLVARRTEYVSGANPNAFVLPVQPIRIVWPLAILSAALPAGASVRVAVTAEALSGSGATGALVWSDGAAADSVLRIETAAATVAADPASATAGETVSFEGSIPGGLPPFTYEWRFGDGNSTSPAGTWLRTVTGVHAYGAPGHYEATLIVTDSTGSAGGASAGVSVVDPSTPTVVSALAADVFLPTLGSARISWRTDRLADGTVEYGPDPANLTSSANHSGTSLVHAVDLPGLSAGTTYAFRVVSNGVASPVGSFTTAGDFTGDAVVVVAVIDTGINPYHAAFRRTGRTAHPATYITGFPAAAAPLVLDFAAPSYGAAVANDAALWNSVEGARLYWVPGTNLVGVIDMGVASALNSAPDTRRILDDDGHGTLTAGTVERANDDVLLVAIEAIGGAGIVWAASQPWIDVISMSFGGVAVPFLGVNAAIEAAAASGKVLVAAAGNTPNPQMVTQPTGFPQVIAVGGSQPSASGEQPEASKGPDVVSDYTIAGLPSFASLSGTATASGTSFAAPNVAGTLSRALGDLRSEHVDVDEGTAGGLVAAAGGTGPFLADGVLTALELREALNRTAVWWTPEDWSPGATVPVAPFAPWVQTGWGHVGLDSADDLRSIVDGAEGPARPAEARAYMELQYEARFRYYRNVQQGP